MSEHRIEQDRSRRLWAVGGVVGPVAFVGCWAIGGLLVEGYDPRVDAISELAAVGASTRVLMSAGFVVFGLGVGLFGLALREALAGPAWVAAVVTGVATLGVAALPLGVSDTVDVLHGVAAGVGYVGLAALPLLAARPLRAAGADRGATVSVVAGVVVGLALALTQVPTIDGLAQRTGLTVGDLWTATAACAILTSSFPPNPPKLRHP